MASQRGGMKRILLVQTGFLGDVVLSTPVIAAVHQRHPGCELWMLVTPQAKGLLGADPLVAG
ncbi:MAG: glycosyltransferase family 9 protein, partial [Deltaproteobacteria bacterium]|nr:glycosyltransferase family 9 protein [Deltaproteobacteria bacterium]